MPVAIRGKDTPKEELLRSIFGKTGSGVYLDETLKQELASYLVGKVRATNSRLEEFEMRYEERGNRYWELSKQIRELEEANFLIKEENEKYRHEVEIYKA